MELQKGEARMEELLDDWWWEWYYKQIGADWGQRKPL